MPFLLELVGYALEAGGADTSDYAGRKPDLVARSAAEFSKPEYRVDILKLEFPADLKWTKEYSGGAFDGKERQPVYALSQVRESCAQVNEAAGVPWVILSAGVDIEEFLVQVDLAVEAGASGFLCGRAIWKDAIGLYPDVPEMERWLSTTSYAPTPVPSGPCPGPPTAGSADPTASSWLKGAKAGTRISESGRTDCPSQAVWLFISLGP